MIVELDNPAIERRDVVKCPLCTHPLWDSSQTTPDFILLKALHTMSCSKQQELGKVWLVLPEPKK